MIRINCPYCGERDHSEFTYGGDASIKYPSLDASEKEWTEERRGPACLREEDRGTFVVAL